MNIHLCNYTSYFGAKTHRLPGFWLINEVPVHPNYGQFFNLSGFWRWPLIENIRKAHLKKRPRFFSPKIGDPQIWWFETSARYLPGSSCPWLENPPRGRSPWRWLVRWEHFFFQKAEGIFHDFPRYSREFLGKDRKCLMVNLQSQKMSHCSCDFHIKVVFSQLHSHNFPHIRSINITGWPPQL